MGTLTVYQIDLKTAFLVKRSQFKFVTAQYASVKLRRLVPRACCPGLCRSEIDSLHFNCKYHTKKEKRAQWSEGKVIYLYISLSRLKPDANSFRKPTCPECGKTYMTKSSLKYHMMNHTGEKPYKCDQCDESFSQRESLEEHVKNHTG